MFKDFTIEKFLKVTSGGEDEGAGGGTASALAGAVGAALSGLVASFTIGRKKFANVEEQMLELREQGTDLCRKLTQLMDEDIEAFNPVMTAMRLPKATEAQREERKARIQEALVGAARVPLRTAEASLKVLELAAQAVEMGNPSTATDAGVAVLLARAGVEGAALNVDVNLASVEDTAVVEELTKRKEEIVEQARVRSQQALEKVITVISK